ncbi:hypothetical protein AB0I49_16815 [Streptomyces sp. NPDC050617]|uniref:hypothetical protein n=1 Tax=Streptomyces sp. NPDC050617 TaxID=3154628 RepID=UPI00342BFC3D
MTAQRCDHCDLLIGAGCACPSEGDPHIAEGQAPRRTGLRGQAPDAIIVSPAGNAHLPGCFHLSDSEISGPKFGWVVGPGPGAWSRISESHPLRATEGNADRVAVRRCLTCDAQA